MQGAEISDLDELLSQIPNPEEILVEPDSSSINPTSHNEEETSAGAVTGRFGSLVGDAEIKLAHENAVPTNMKKPTTWAVNMWTE